MSSLPPKTIPTKSGQPVTIRSAQPEDVTSLLAHARSVAAESPFFVTEPDEFDFTEKWVQDHLDGPGKLVLIAEIPDEVIGCLSFENGSRRRIAHRGSLGISVCEKWRGQGIGSALLQALIDWAEANPLIERIGLVVLFNNEGAIRLYRRFGFVEEGRRPRAVKLGPEQYADELLMYRLV